jgi:hypothetical protein
VGAAGRQGQAAADDAVLVGASGQGQGAAGAQGAAAEGAQGAAAKGLIEEDDSDSDDSDSDEDIEEGEVKEEMKMALATLKDKKPSLRYGPNPSIWRCYFCRGKKINPWTIIRVLQHAEGYAAAHNRPNHVRGKHRALVRYIRTHPKFASARAAHGIV